MGFLYRTKLRVGSRLYRFLHRQERNAYRHNLNDSGFLTVGRHTYGDPAVDLSEGNTSKVSIGSFCSFARGVIIIPGGEHPTDWVSTYPFRIKWGLPGAGADGLPASKGDVVIGSDVWVGTEAMILSGVTIGPGAVIAARSVVTRDVPPYAIAAGIPARVVRMRFDPETIASLLRIRWWEWSDEQIRSAVPHLSSPQIDEFLKLHDTSE